jgi:hypothetical protein
MPTKGAAKIAKAQHQGTSPVSRVVEIICPSVHYSA